MNRAIASIENLTFLFNGIHIDKPFDHDIWEMFSVNPAKMQIPCGACFYVKDGKETKTSFWLKTLESILSLQNKYTSLEKLLEACIRFEQIINLRNIEQQQLETQKLVKFFVKSNIK